MRWEIDDRLMVDSIKTLVVSESLLPKRCGSSIVMENFAAHFSADELVLLGDCAFGKRTEHQRQQGFPEVEYFGTAMSLGGRGARFFKRLRWRLLDRLVKRIMDVATRHRCNHILGVYPDDLWCYAACLAAKRLNVPFDSYFHNTYVDNDAIEDVRAQQYQAEIFERSRTVFVMSDGMLGYMRDTYPEVKFSVLTHVFCEYPSRFEREPVSVTGTKRIVLFGNFNQSNLDATLRLQAAVRSRCDYELHFYTDVPRLLLAQRGLNVSTEHYHGALGHLSFDDMMSEIRQYDLVALTHGLTGGYGAVEYQTIFPTRTIPMMLSGLPLLVHSPENAFLSEFVREHGIGCLVTQPSESELVAALDRLVADRELADDKIRNAMTAAGLFFGQRVTSQFRDQIRRPAV
ncbi:glycosyltransferase family protein [Stieleria varia]|uniref:glycosyltransferase family 4 protein n=1 Tax=Stieleria varia TaxID=2528005 RepID=UPI0011B7D0D0|nr:glycosyltransferase family 4 protein [Stieleria varia]